MCVSEFVFVEDDVEYVLVVFIGCCYGQYIDVVVQELVQWIFYLWVGVFFQYCFYGQVYVFVYGVEQIVFVFEVLVDGVVCDFSGFGYVGQ